MYATPQHLSRKAASLLVAVFFIFGAALIMSPLPAKAAGGDDPAPVSKPACPTMKTKNACLGQNHCFWSNSRTKCKTKKNRSENNADDKLYLQGRALAKSGEYAKAIELLKTADQTDPQVLNYLGYSYRKSGDLTTGIKYYKLALAIDPDFVLAREYLGEGYVKAGRIDLAKLELAAIEKICGTACEEYIDLAAVIEKGGGVSSY